MNNISNTAPVCLAVLPFENLSGNPEHDYFATGFVEDLITDLSHFHSLQVISSYTSRKMGKMARDALSEAKTLSIDYLLKGNLRRKGRQMRLNTQLLETDSGRIIWAQRYDAPVETVLDIQDDIVERVSGAISARIDHALLAAARKKPLTSLAAYDCWLRGMDQLRKGTPEADQKARRIFEQALAIDPHYSRAYAGLSLSFFNEWSCQLWEHWDETERNAYKYAKRAIELDDTDHVTQLILGRILLYRRRFDAARHHIDQSLALNANDADNLIQIATCDVFLGKAEKGESLFLKAMRLNPYRNQWYYTGGSFTYFAQRKFQTCIDLALKGPLTDVWVDLPAFIAAAYAHLSNHEQAARYLEIFSRAFHEKIITDHTPSPAEIIAWVKTANPFQYEADMAILVDGLMAAGLDCRSNGRVDERAGQRGKRTALQPNAFVNQNGLWEITFDDTQVQIPEVKGFHDLARLLAAPGDEVHCTEMMGTPDAMSDADPMVDAKALQAYKQRVQELREEIRDAEQMNDLGRSEKLTVELDQLTDHIAKAMGLGHRTRRLKAPAERARAAVTWRIRSAIKKIDAVHPSLGHHLSNAIRTGTFCCYSPEKNLVWQL
jgi:TolB-like protein/Tfp pilus assembly protein PilF